MRIWDIPPSKLCRKHLLGEHRELHAIWSVLTNGKRGYSNHPETKRWVGKLKALFIRHQQLVKEMKNRGWKHKSDLIEPFDQSVQDVFVDTPEKQVLILRSKKCECKV